VTICPCCGFKSANSQTGVSPEACLSCGAHSVGEPLPRPENELPSYGRSLLLVVIGAVAVLVFAVETIIAMSTRVSLSSGFWSWMAGPETAAWRLKWAAIPLAAVVLFGSRRIYRSILLSPARFCCRRAARNGYLASAAVPLLVLLLIGITVPERLLNRQLAMKAEIKAKGYRIDRALVEYRQAFGTLPSELKDLSRLQDADGSIAAALKNVDAAGYTVESEVAAVPTKKPRALGGAVILNASRTTTGDEPLSAAISFTNYQFRLPGLDKALGTDDDLVLIDGVIYPLSEVPRGRVGARSASQIRTP
jgi:hypothetical protein